MGRIAQTKTTKDGTLGTYMAKSDHVDAITNVPQLRYSTISSNATLPGSQVYHGRALLNFLVSCKFKLTIYTRSNFKSLVKSQAPSLYAIYPK